MNKCPHSRQAAVDAGERFYTTGLPCKRGHTSKRRTSDRKCIECQYALLERFNKQKAEKVKQYKQKWVDNNKEYVRLRALKYRKANRDMYRQKQRAYYAKNSAELTMVTLSRLPHIKRATPAWASYEKMLCIYKECAKKTLETGIKHEVDHIIPFRSKLVCGLHVENNLRIVTARENKKKAAKFQVLGHSVVKQKHSREPK